MISLRNKENSGIRRTKEKSARIEAIQEQVLEGGVKVKVREIRRGREEAGSGGRKIRGDGGGR